MVGKIFEERDVDADELPPENLLEAGDDEEVQTMGEGVLEPMSGTQLSNQPKDEVVCNRKGEEEIGGLSNVERDDGGQGGGGWRRRIREGEIARRCRGMECRRRGGRFFFFLSNRAPRKRKEARTMPSAVKGAASPWFTAQTCWW